MSLPNLNALEKDLRDVVSMETSLHNSGSPWYAGARRALACRLLWEYFDVSLPELNGEENREQNPEHH